MISSESLMVFLAASVALGLAPGPDNIFVLTQSALHGRMAGFIVTLGLCTGLIVHTAAVAIGVAAILQSSALAFTILKIVGAIYLLYLAWRAFQSKPSRLASESDAGTRFWPLYRRGIIMNVTNPKVALFFLAFLPQFADPALGPLTAQLFLLGGLFIFATLLVFGTVAWAAGYIGEWVSSSETAQIIMNRVAGVVFVGLALRLVATER
jgi:threonine/homoserine/homoserine lactone efflux protein